MIILCYHDLSENPANPWMLHPDSFSEHLHILAGRGYRIVDMNTYSSEFPTEPNVAVITFDDGRESCTRQAIDSLNAFNFTATFYVCPGFIEGTHISPCEAYSGFIGWKEIRSLADAGHTIGSHSVSHTSFRKLMPAEQYGELVRSKKQIEEHIGHSCQHFAAPYGFLDCSITALSKEAGYVTAASTIWGINRSKAALSFLRRWEITSPCDGNCFDTGLSALESARNRFRVAVLAADVIPSLEGPYMLSTLASYDAILTANEQAREITDFYHVLSIDPAEYHIDPTELQSGVDEKTTAFAAHHLKKQLELAGNTCVEFDFYGFPSSNPNSI